MDLKRVERVLVPFEGDAGDLVSVAEAARQLGITMPGVISALQRGAFTEIVDTSALKARQGRRFLLRSEIFED